jgi:tRNA 2-thiocytidine biosynthesis protein TtcA
MRDETDVSHPLFSGAPDTDAFRRLRKHLVKDARAAIETYGMVVPGARSLIWLSRGKDSYILRAILHELKWRGLLPVDLLACNLDQGQPEFPATALPRPSDTHGGAASHRIP